MRHVAPSLLACLLLNICWHAPACAQRATASSELESFQRDEDETVLPGFGSSEIRYRYTRDDLEDAERLLRRYDDDDSGALEPDEVDSQRWNRGDPFQFDFNRDARLTVTELAQREAFERGEVATRRPQFKTSSSYSWFSRRLSDAAPSHSEVEVPSRQDRSSRDSRSMAGSILGRYDRNRSRDLSEWELKDSGIAVSDADEDRDGKVSFRELDAWVFGQIDQRVHDYSDILPDWFFEKDLNDDGQIEMGEFSQQWDADSLARFSSIDTNSDGIVTTSEILNSKSSVGGRFTMDEAEVLPPRSKWMSEIVVDEGFTIDKLQVELSITHSYVEQLDGYLLGPDGQRIELFSSVGRSDDNFEGTIFDDEARESIRRGRAPFRDRYQPSGLEKRQPGLGYFHGKSIEGVWTLLIETDRSERFGILHNWSLIATPES